MNGSGAARILARLWFLVIAVVAIAILYLAKVLFLPLAFAILFAFLLAPVVSLLERLRLTRALAAVLVILGFATLLGVAGWMLFTQLVAVTNDLPIYRDNIAQKMEAIHSPSDSAFSRAEQEVQRLSEELGLANSSAVLHSQPQKSGNKQLGSSPERPVQVREVARPTGRLDQLGGIVEPLTTSFLCVVFTFFVLLQREDLRNRLIHLSGVHNLSVMTQAMKDASARISRYFSLQLLVNVAYGSLVFAALYFIGLPHALLFAAVAALLRFVPYVGAPIAVLLPTLLSLAVFHGMDALPDDRGHFPCARIVHRQLRRTTHLRQAYGSFLAGDFGGGGILDTDMGTGGAGLVCAADGLPCGHGQARPSARISDGDAGRPAGGSAVYMLLSAPAGA